MILIHVIRSLFGISPFIQMYRLVHLSNVQISKLFSNVEFYFIRNPTAGQFTKKIFSSLFLVMVGCLCVCVCVFLFIINVLLVFFVPTSSSLSLLLSLYRCCVLKNISFFVFFSNFFLNYCAGSVCSCTSDLSFLN